MSGSATRHDAVEAVTSYEIPHKDFTEPLGELFGKNVFDLSRMKAGCPRTSTSRCSPRSRRVPRSIPSIADAVASAMRDWALENGASHYAHVFYPLTGLTAEKHDSFLEPDSERQLAGPVHRQDADRRASRTARASPTAASAARSRPAATPAGT